MLRAALPSRVRRPKRRLASLAVLLACGLLLAGCQAPGVPERVAGQGDVRPDPASDRLGWEDGHWHDDAIDVDRSDGLDASERAAIVGRAKARVEEIRRLEFDGNVSVETVDRATYRNRSNGERNETLGRFDNAKFEALFLVGERSDSVGTQEASRDATVLGYYSPARDAIVVVGDDPAAALDGELTLAHELVHALQDQHLDVEDVRARTRDAAQGRLSILEGDPMAVQWAYADRCGAEWRCLRSGGDGGGSDGAGSSGGAGSSDDGNGENATDDGDGTATGSAAASENGSGGHFGINVLTYFPYSAGHGFVESLRERGGWAAVDDAYGSVPDGAAEVVAPERYPDWEPASVSVPAPPGDEWQRVRPPGRPDHGVPGQSAIAAGLAYTLVDGYAPDESVVAAEDAIRYSVVDGRVRLDREEPYVYDGAAVDGWAGGRFHAYRNGSDGAYVWRTRWNSSQDAGHFAATWGRLVEHWGGKEVGDPALGHREWVIRDGPFADAVAIHRDGRTVTVANAPDRDALGEVYDAA